MPKALFFNVPAHGHINPSLPLVAELVRQGHHITYFASQQFCARIEAAGAVFNAYRTVDDHYFDVNELDGGRPQKVACELLKTTDEILPELLDTARKLKPDYVLYDGMCPWGYFVARILGVPAVVSYSLMAPSTPSLREMKWEMVRAIAPLIFRDFGQGLEANRRSWELGKKYGVPPLGAASLLNAPGDLAISYTSSYFQPFASSVAPTVRFVGRTVDESDANTPFSFEQLQNRKLIYASLGTINNDNLPFFKMCIEAFANTDYFVILSTGNRINPESFGALPENISIHGWVPQNEVLKRASLFISHAGLNSIHDALYFGVPLLLVPQQREQLLNALRVVELGAGLMLKPTQITPETLHVNSARLLEDTRFKSEAARIGETFRSAGGMKYAVNEIEALLLSVKNA